MTPSSTPKPRSTAPRGSWAGNGKTSATNQIVKAIWVRVGPSGGFAPATKAQLWTMAPSPARLHSIELGGLTGADGDWLAVPGVQATKLTAGDPYIVTIYHPATDPGVYLFKNGFGNPSGGSLSGSCIYRNGGTDTVPPDDESFTHGGFGVDIEIGDATPTPPSPVPGSGSKALAVKAFLKTLLDSSPSVAATKTEVTYGFPTHPPSRRWALVGDVRWVSSEWTTNRSREERFTVKVFFSIQLPAGDAAQAEHLAVACAGDFETALKTNPGLSGLAVSSSFAPVSLLSWPIDGAYEAQYETEVTATCRT